MTCGIAVKRPFDFESYLPDSSEPKRSRHATPQCSPFRPQLGTLATSLTNASIIQRTNIQNGSPFNNVSNNCHLSSNQLDSYLRAEVQYLKRRKLIPRRNLAGFKEQAEECESTILDASKTSDYRGASSPSSTNGSDSDNETMNSAAPSQSKNLKPLSHEETLSELYEKPHFSLRQVKMICERLLKEQEHRLRYEYETLLIKKLEEKHEQFAQYAKEQLECQSTSTRDFSYFS